MSADTIVSGFATSQTLNRYSYVINNPLRYTDPTGYRMLENEYGGGCSTTGYCPGSSTSNNNNNTSNNYNNDDDETTSPTTPSDLAAMATVLDTVAAGLNGGYTIVGDIVMLACSQCELAVLGGYQYYSYIPNSISTLSMGLWFMDGVNTGENDLTISQTSQGTNVSVSISQDTLLALGTNVAGWTILREPNAAFLVDAGVAGYDYARMGMIPFVDHTLPAFINPTLRYNTSTGIDFSWIK